MTDLRKVNQCTKTDSYPIPRIEDCIDKIGNVKFDSKLDLLKGSWQVPLTDRAKEISAFCTPDLALPISRYAVWYEKRTGNFSKNGQSH